MPVHRAAALSLACCWTLSLALPAAAQDDSGSEGDQPEESETDAPVPDQEKAQPTRRPQAPAPSTDRSVERWPASAYPEPQVRGLHGGSLWMTMHGLQWPYAPQVTGEPETRFGLSGSVWIDTGYKQVDSTNATFRKDTRWLQEGRFVLRATPTYSAGPWFVQGQAELVAGKDQTPVARIDADDVWVRAGKWKAFDVQAGRFEAWEIYHYGMGLDLYTLERRGAEIASSTPASIYGATFMFERPADVGNLALHAYPTDTLRFELLGQLGNTGLNTFGLRPAAVFDLGWLKLKAALEWRKQTALSDSSKQESEAKGGAGAVQFVLDPHVEFGVNVGYGLDDNFSSTGEHELARSLTRFSVGGFANARLIKNLLIGAGFNSTRHEDIQEDPSGRVGEFEHLQAFGAVQYLLLDQLFVKAVFGWAKATVAPSFTNDAYENSMLSARIRALFLF